jgi:hypothetical protein
MLRFFSGHPGTFRLPEPASPPLSRSAAVYECGQAERGSWWNASRVLLQRRCVSDHEREENAETTLGALCTAIPIHASTHILQKKLNLRDRVQAVVLAHETRLFADDAKPIHPLGEPPARSAPANAPECLLSRQCGTLGVEAGNRSAASACEAAAPLDSCPAVSVPRATGRAADHPSRFPAGSRVRSSVIEPPDPPTRSNPSAR